VPPCACAILFDPGWTSASRISRHRHRRRRSLPSTTHSCIRNFRGSIAWLRAPCVRFAAAVTDDHATLGIGWLATPCRAGPSPAEALHEVSAHLHASSSSVFIWRTMKFSLWVERPLEHPGGERVPLCPLCPEAAGHRTSPWSPAGPRSSARARARCGERVERLAQQLDRAVLGDEPGTWSRAIAAAAAACTREPWRGAVAAPPAAAPGSPPCLRWRPRRSAPDTRRRRATRCRRSRRCWP